MDGKADLHLHTLYSDGALPPRDLLQQARQAGLTTISITDHDNTGALQEALEHGALLGVAVIPGVELSTTVDGQDIHLLGYFIDPGNTTLQEHLALFRAERYRRAERIVRKLNELKVPLSFEAVQVRAGRGSIGRPHIAGALVEEGFIDSYQEAFSRYLGFGRPAYERKYQVSPRDAIRLVAEAGGLSFIAHPGNAIDERVLLALIKEGVDGIEVVHPSHSEERTAYYRGIAEEYFLLASGGSDFHGGPKRDSETLGRYTITEEAVEMMRRRLR
jgi:predicted metal-dependent phosphoesterase TrpH